MNNGHILRLFIAFVESVGCLAVLLYLSVFYLSSNACYAVSMEMKTHKDTLQPAEQQSWTPNSPKLEISPEALLSSLRSDFGIEVKNLTRAAEGDHSTVYKGSLDDSVVFVRINRNRTIFEIEVPVIELLAKYSVPVPEVVGCKLDTSLGYPVMIESAARGTCTTEYFKRAETDHSLQLESIVASMAEVLRDMHTIQIEGFGGLRVDDERLRGTFTTWKEYNKNRHTYSRYLEALRLVDASELEILKRVESDLREIEMAQGVFLHRDYHSEHIFTDGTAVTGVIDFGVVKAGDPRTDIAYALYFLEPKYRGLFRESYGPLAQDPIVDKYLLSTAASKIAYRHLNGFTDRLTRAMEEFESAIKKF